MLIKFVSSQLISTSSAKSSESQYHPPQQMDGTALTGMYPYEEFILKNRPFGEEHGDFGV